QAGTLYAQELHDVGINPVNSHFSLVDNSDPPARAFRLGYGTGATFRTVGENLGFGFPSPSALVEAWMNSPTHRANILNNTVKELGIGVFFSNDGFQVYC